jgi:hypothetical protein
LHRDLGKACHGPTAAGVDQRHYPFLASHLEVHDAAVATVQTVLPLPWKEARSKAINAVACTNKYHSCGRMRST